jgi:DNA polymerase (family 10)
MDKNAVAIVLEEIGVLLELHGENRFKARAFTNAARSIQDLKEELELVMRAGRLESIAGIGPATAAVVRDLVQTGESRYYAQLRERTPPGLLELLAVPRLGMSRIRELHEKLGIASLEDLEQAARSGRIAGLRGYGAKTESRILEGIAYVRGTAGRRRYAEIIDLADRLRGFTQSLEGVQRVDHAGEYRRGCETASGLELVAEVARSKRAGVIESFVALPGARMTNHDRDTAGVRFSDGFGVTLTCVSGEAYGAALFLRTGSIRHTDEVAEEARRQNLAIRAEGLFRGDERIEAREEAIVYEAAGLPWIPPELRETGEEVAAARNNMLPRLVRYEDLQGCFHCHTVFSDGKASVEAMAEAGRQRGWRYLGIADHSQYAGYAGGLSPEQILQQHEEIEAWNARNGKRLWLFKGIEADILPDGRLDYEDQPDLLARFDFVVASIHSAFGLSREEQTRRMLRAMQNPHVTFLGHLTGRLLLSRRGYELDLETVFAAAAERGISIEINSDPWRMDMDWRHWPRAKEIGIKSAVNPDAHSQSQLDFVRYGIAVARKGWLQPENIVNCWPLERVEDYLHSSRAARRGE